jgi:RNAse (barnase) inhibitor barstar
MLHSDHNTIEQSSKQQFTAVLDGKRCKTLAEFYVQINAALRFPDYFGANLDALYDCLCDLSWLEQKHVVLIFTRAELLLSQAKADEKAALLETLEQAETNQYEPERSFEVILLGHDKA